MFRALLASLFLFAAPAAWAGDKGDHHMTKVESNASAAETVERLTNAVKGAGATVFAVIDHQAGAKSIDLEMRPTTLVLFGNPKMGSPAMIEQQLLGIDLPLHVLVMEDEAGKVWLAYEDPAHIAKKRGLSEEHPSIKGMQGALKKLTAKAAGA